MKDEAMTAASTKDYLETDRPCAGIECKAQRGADTVDHLPTDVLQVEDRWLPESKKQRKAVKTVTLCTRL